ncbi:sacsin isoform X1 [Rhizophagus clarus]|uniref:Sacsin isoform X1 n=1 Tax=Rhizophagus clarus TaxID=94130 RepID=A0A8H3LU55_9GLOM|nr:sacsin isoform X1 [Rhizophagus clarus]
MSNAINNSRASRRAKGREFKPREPYTHRLRKILEEYPDGSQVLREILQNSDDAKSTEQIFILDHNTYSSDSLFEPDLVNNYKRTNLKLDRFQGPALLAKNNTIFKERDFQSLLKLADSEKRDQFDKIGVMGVGFNSIYHITDSPSFITGDKYVILDPHEWYFNGGVQFDFVEDNLAMEYPDQFAPFRISCNKPYEGTIFRYPLRTDEDSIDSDISKKIYKSEEILDIFRKFFENESINCLLFLKYVECISFYELKEGSTEPELLYMIKLENADKVRKQRRLIAENVISMMNRLQSKTLGKNNQLQASYVASFSRQQKGDCKKISWLILNYLDDLNEAETYFQNKFNKNIVEYKFVPNVGLAIPLENLDVTGRLFCFLPLPISMPFRVSVHGYFAVSTNRRSLWSAADNEDLAADALARIKVAWNRYLFEVVLPKAWVKFLRKIHRGPSSSNTIGTVYGVPAESYNDSSFKGSEFHWLSISNGYFEDERLFNYDVSKIIGNIGFPVISVSPDIMRVLKSSKHKEFLSTFSPAIIRTYLNYNRARWESTISRKEVLELFNYILRDKKFDELVGFKMIPLADGTLDTITQSSNSCVYICPDDDIKDKNDERNIFKNQLNKFVDKSIELDLYQHLYNNAKAGWDGWNLNIKILNESVVADMIRSSLKFDINEGSRIRSIFGNIGKKIRNSFADNEEIQILDRREWIYQLWENLKYRNWDLTKFEDLHLIPTRRSTLRKLNTPKKVFSHQMSKNISILDLISIFEKFGAVFVDNEFDTDEISKWDKLTPYIINPDNIISVLNSFRIDISYPGNLHCALQNHEASTLVEYLSVYLRLANRSHLEPRLINAIKHFPIFTEIDNNTSTISLLSKEWYLLPRNEENSYGKIIYPTTKGGFLSASSQNLCYILEDIIRIPRLTVYEYWRYYVIPYLESRQQKDIDIVIDKLFDRLPSLLDDDIYLKDVLGGISFVPVGTFKMSQQQKLPVNVKLAKPNELFDPEEKALVNLFFDNEQVFPVGKYGIPQPSLSKKFLLNLRSLGIKPVLSPNDIISRINTIATRRLYPNVQEKALNLFKYIDENWEVLNINYNHAFLKAILEKDWIPSFDASEKLVFSKPKNCYCQNYKNLISLVSPVIEIKVNNEKFLQHLGWDTYPEVTKVLKQLDLCCKGVSNKHPPKNLKPICADIYKYMNDAFRASDNKSREEFDIIKKYLRYKSWILCEGQFYPTEKVVFSLPSKFQNNDSLIVELPIEYTSKFKPLFKSMGVRDEIGVKDLITIIRNTIKGNKDKVLSANELNNVIRIIEQIAKIQKENRREGDKLEKLDGLLIPSNENMLIELHEIHFDDMDDRLDEEMRSNLKITHNLVTLDVARELEIQTLTGKIYGNSYAGDIDWKTYEQNESLTTRIKNIIKDYSINSLFKEFLQNADDAKATRFFVIVDEREANENSAQKTLFSEEMKDWQGPAIWIYNDAEFSPEDFQSLIKLGVGGKSHDDTKIGKFGIGFNCAFHVTDLPSLVSGRYIAFLDPNARYLPAQGYPPRRPRGTRIDFIDKEFKKSFPGQCYPYEALGCDFSEEFKGTLFRLPLRTLNLAGKSEITNRVIEINEILRVFNSVEGNKEMLFLRNIESCGLHRLREKIPQLIWKAQINLSDTHRDIRRSVTDKPQIYQLDIELNLNFDSEKKKKISQIWLLCTGGQEKIKPEFRDLKKFAKEKRLKSRGGVASLLVQSDEKPLDNLKAESYPDPPELRGEMFSYLSLSMISNLSVHLNCNFSLSTARSSILQPDSDFLQADCVDAKWNRYILYEILPELHIKLLEEIAKLEEIRHKKDKSNFIPHLTNNFWPIGKNLTMDLYKSYGLNVIRSLTFDKYKIFWTEANGGKFVSLSDARIINKEDTVIADILVNLHHPVPIVKLDEDKIEQLNEIVGYKKFPISGKLVCEELRLRNQKNSIIHESIIKKNKHIHDSLFQLLDFILKDKNSFRVLTGLPLVPLSDGSVGKFGEVYYVGKQKHLDLFPNASSSKFIFTKLPENLQKIFNDDEFSLLTKIKKFDAPAILDLLEYELTSVKELSWDPNGKSIPNISWLKEIWSKLNKDAENIDFIRLSKFPLLPVIKPSDILVQPDTKKPLLYVPENGHTLFPVLVKLKVRFTNMIVPDNANENLKRCIVDCSPINIIHSLEITRSSLNLTMKELFEHGNLSSSDYEKLRTFIKENLEVLEEYGQVQEKFTSILKSLPIWPIHSCEDNYIDATSGNLFTYKLRFFSFFQNTDIYKCNESDFNALKKLGATLIGELEYIVRHIIRPISTMTPVPTPSKEYIAFLQDVLSSENHQEIELFIKHYPLIPNKSLTAFVKADTLYDTNILLFRSIFAERDLFLPPELQNTPYCLEALGRMGLNREINCSTFIDCAEEIESQIQQEGIPANVIRDRAKNLVRYLYEHVDTLNFNSGQWRKILRIKFVPSEKNIKGQIYQSPKETSGFEPFEKLCSHKHKNVCWTQCPLFDESVEPTKFSFFNDNYPEIGNPSTENIIEHWFFVIKQIRSSAWNSKRSMDDYESIKGVIKEIYKILNEISQNKNNDTLIRLKINNPDKKLFLNDDYPFDIFDKENWVAGRDLIFGLQEDIKEGMYKVKDCLKEYKELLLLAGARELIDLKSDRKIRKHDQKDALIKVLLKKFIDQRDNDHHDVIFVVGDEKARIGANRYVLSAASTHFERMFCGGLSESTESKIEVIIKDIRPEVFQVLLRWLYGQPFEEATKSILRNPEEFNKTDQECYETYFLSFLVDVLKVTDIYSVERLKDEVEDIIITGSFISVCNVCEILLWSKECKATQLKNHCKKYIELNKELVTEQRLEYCANATSEQERLEESEMLELLLKDDE